MDDGFLTIDDVIRRASEPKPPPKPITLTHKRRRQLRKKRK